MKPKHSAKFLLRKFVEEFDAEQPFGRDKLGNQKYLEFHLKRLELMHMQWENNSHDPQLTVRQRARCRDLAQCAQGLINGIKFGISFILHQEEDLDRSIEAIGQANGGK